ncbi:MAG: NnrU protein [Pseudomonadales bacterium]|nr:NnrU protein [Pseudomonadales bacterium]
MELLLAGLLLWSLLHLLPASAQPLRAVLLGRLGMAGYKLGFTGLILVSIALMVFGWRSMTPEPMFVTTWLPLYAAYAGIFVGLWLMVASSFNTRLKRVLRHPQLTGFMLWALVHLLVNGDNRSILLFGGLLLWALLEIVALNRRDGRWQKPSPPPWPKEFFVLVATAFVFSLLFIAHPWFTGRTLPY